jgi:hypothetical protein
MKKRIYLLLLSITIIFFSCIDDSGKFEEQIFTNEQITTALRECIRVTTDSTTRALCVVDTLDREQGFSYYNAKAYRIGLPLPANQLIDTLTEYGLGDTLDTLVMNINRAAEKCGNRITQFWDPIIKNITFHNPNKTLHVKNSAITDDVKNNYQIEFVNILRNFTLKEQFQDLDIILIWNGLQDEYRKITGSYTSIDLLESSVQQMVDGYFKMMALMEEAVRTKPELRGDDKGWLFKVFATL